MNDKLELIALAATICDEAKELDLRCIARGAGGCEALDNHAKRCQMLYLKLCGYQDPRHPEPVARDEVHAAALKVVAVLGESDGGQIRIPMHLALALLNLRNAVRRPGSFDARVADTLARKCDELQRELDAVRKA